MEKLSKPIPIDALISDSNFDIKAYIDQRLTEALITKLAPYADGLTVYGIWVLADDDSEGGWMRDTSGNIFQTLSRTCADAQLKQWFRVPPGINSRPAEVRAFES